VAHGRSPREELEVDHRLIALYRAAAATVVVAHLAFVLFVVCGGVLVLRRGWMAWLHVPAAIWAVVVEYSGWICPLTPLENALRGRAGLPLYSGDFIAEYIFPLLYPENLTRATQFLLGTIALAINGAVYWRVVRHRLRCRRLVRRR